MKILRSQYLKLQNNAGGQLLPFSGVKENILTNEQELVKHRNVHHNAKSSTVSVAGQTTISKYSVSATNIQIWIDNFDQSVTKLNVIVEFTSIEPFWLTKVYKTYENDFWHKEVRFTMFGIKKWWFYCRLCGKTYKGFASLKAHLNMHMEFYPYVCKLCSEKYTNRKSATRHLRSIHNIDKEQWNEFLVS